MDALTIALTPAAAFAAAAAAPFLQRALGRGAGWMLAIVPLAIFLGLLRLVPAVASGEPLVWRIAWVPSYGIDLAFLLDGLSLTFALAIAGIGTLVVLYSGAYLAGHPHQGRFFGFLFAFMGGMLGLVLADSTPALFGFWEITSVTSFLLIGFDHRRQAARRAAIQAIIITSSGGLGLLVAAVAMHVVAGSWDLSALRAAGSLATNPAYLVVLLPLVVAAFTKSAQLPFHFWLLNAMEAPTPVSAFLHSATMVQAGVYLLARMNPLLGGTPAWTGILTVFGGATLLWGAFGALRQTDLKQMLAQTTVASLGLLILLIGLGTEAAITAMAVYFVTHALYKAGLFLVVGAIDHETGVRDLLALRGLRESMAVCFIAALMAAFSMLGLPPAIGYLAKESMYAPLVPFRLPDLILAAVLVLGNGLIGAAGLAVALKPFIGERLATPKTPHEGPPDLLAGPIVLGAAGLAAIFGLGQFGDELMAPMAGAIAGHGVAVHLAFAANPLEVAFWLSLATWGIAALAYWRLGGVRAGLRRAEAGLSVSFDGAFDWAMFGLIRLAARVTHAWHHGRLELYVTVVFSMLVIALFAPLAVSGALPPIGVPRLGAPEWAVAVLAAVGIVAVLLAPNRLVSILALGVQGLATAVIFLLFGAPDLAFTQFMVEVLTVVVLALVMSRLRLDIADRRPRPDLIRDAALSILTGGGVALALLMVLAGPFNAKLPDFFAQMSVAQAHGHNIVNVILVDFRGLDTLGEISVVMGAGIAIMVVLGSRRARRPRANAHAPAPPPATRKGEPP